MFEVHVCKAALREIKQLVFKPIFRRVYSKKMDEYLRQADIEDLGDAMDFIDGTIKAQVEHANEDWEVRAVLGTHCIRIQADTTKIPTKTFPRSKPPRRCSSVTLCKDP
ncbi:hypothetical protein PF005_g8486 [Phytophthora fragariae]|uniref:Uncharacterized protein n=1 Tax=Phytophthora fragariae TaxID=53985 RepID=A0A6A4E6Q4_9STRA|nr:hypothetical protein PF003_g18336 [Phytophthora fragariae]KAE8940901.1 hypothetical protein PF009_g9296 [Phytophthora fragariae]KAE9017174.1 hypothetical protein PF011_g6813 [Phytophthora fragariae]KAE9150413.1 hypothetical protein PF006_g5203 [Phytophthora fragariae]KAE9217886.1 hypothetical protein PF005_g8486 [Phytophthora fragariae]